MTSFWQDIRYSLRMIAKAPGYAAIVIFTLALGIGANSTIFSWINSALLNPVPGLAHPSEVVSLTEGKPEDYLGFSYPDIQALRDGQQSFTAITAFIFAPFSLTGKGKPERVWGMVATANYFDVLGVRPILGRGFLPAEDEKPGAAPVAVISYRLWQTHFAANQNVVGQHIEINQHSYTIVGVAPPVFQGSITGLRMEIWVPIMMAPQLMPGNDLLHDHHNLWLFAFARLKPGVTLTQAQAEMSLLLKREARNYPEEHKGHDSVTAYPLWRNPFSFNIFFSILLPALMAIAGLVLLLACANVANLMLVRSVGRQREIAIRMSLGASRWRLVRQLLVESLMLALAGGAVALLITLWTAGTLMKFLPATDFPISLVVRADRSVLLVTMLISLLTGVIFGILPALRASSVSPIAGIERGRWERLGWTAQGALGEWSGRGADFALAASPDLRGIVHSQLPARTANQFGIQSAQYADCFLRSVPSGIFRCQGCGIRSPGRRQTGSAARYTIGGPGQPPAGIFAGLYEREARRLPAAAERINGNADGDRHAKLFSDHADSARAGTRLFAPGHRNSQRAVIVSEAFVNRYWPHQEPLGKRLNQGVTHEWCTVVGVARDSKMTRLDAEPTPFVYLPLYQVYQAAMIVNARVVGDPMTYGKTVERTLHELNADLVVFDVTSLESSERISSFPQRIAGTFVGAFGLLALLLAAVGIYGVTAYTTRQRTHEIGIRMALGANKDDILRLVLGQALRLVLVGVALGLAASFVLTRYLSSLLLGVTSTDALTFSGVALLLCAVALAACFLPARRATRLDPMAALHYE